MHRSIQQLKNLGSGSITRLFARMKPKISGTVSHVLTERECYVFGTHATYIQVLNYADYDELAEKLEAVWEEHQWQNAAFYFVITAPLYKRCVIEKPDVSDEEIMQTLPWNAKEYFTQPMTEIVLDYIDIPVPSASKKKVQVYGTERKLMHFLSRIGNKSGKVQSIVPDELVWLDVLEPMALGQLLIYQRPEQDLELLAVTDSGFSFSRQFRGTAELGRAGKDVTLLDIDTIILEVQRSIDYIVSQLKLPDIKNIYLALDLKDIEIVRTRLEEILTVPTHVIHNAVTGSAPDKVLVHFNYTKMVE